MATKAELNHTADMMRSRAMLNMPDGLAGMNVSGIRHNAAAIRMCHAADGFLPDKNKIPYINKAAEAKAESFINAMATSLLKADERMMAISLKPCTSKAETMISSAVFPFFLYRYRKTDESISRIARLDVIDGKNQFMFGSILMFVEYLRIFRLKELL